MATRISEGSPNPVAALLSRDDFLNFNETSNTLEKTLDAIQEGIERRAVIYMQHHEKQQQSLEVQMKWEKVKKEFTKKIEILKDAIQEKKSELMKIENSYLDLKNKVNYERESNNGLKDKVNQLEYERQQKYEKFYQTADLYSTVISRYKDYLDICIDLEKKNASIATIHFRNCKKSIEGGPFIKLEVLDENKVKVLKTDPFNEENSEKILQHHEIVLFVNKFQQQLNAFNKTTVYTKVET